MLLLLYYQWFKYYIAIIDINDCNIGLHTLLIRDQIEPMIGRPLDPTQNYYSTVVMSS